MNNQKPAMTHPGPAPSGWQPIATVPKDGTAFLGFFPERQGYVARQDVIPMYWNGSDWCNSLSGYVMSITPTHWMPLPPAPGDAPPPDPPATCADCGCALNEGTAKVFTVCDDCWDVFAGKKAAPPVPSGTRPENRENRFTLDASEVTRRALAQVRDDLERLSNAILAQLPEPSDVPGVNVVPTLLAEDMETWAATLQNQIRRLAVAPRQTEER